MLQTVMLCFHGKNLFALEMILLITIFLYVVKTEDGSRFQTVEMAVIAYLVLFQWPPWEVHHSFYNLVITLLLKALL
jgi:hypothetical protein